LTFRVGFFQEGMGFMNARRLTVTASDSPRVLLGALAGVALACAMGLAGSAPALAAECPNESLRSGARSTELAQCRVYEMVSPVDTADSGVGYFAGAAPDGEAAEFVSAGGFAGIQSNNGFNFYIARRGSEGWGTSWIGVPAALGGTAVGTTTSFDLTKQMMRLQFLTGEKAGSTGLLLSENLAAAPALSFGEVPEYPNIPHEGTIRGVEAPSDASPELSHVVVPGNHDALGGHVLYELAGVGGPVPVLRTVSVNSKEETIDGNLGSGSGGGIGGSMFHAISNDGAEIFFSNYEQFKAPTASYVRVNGSKTLPLGGVFQGASEDGAKVFLSVGAGALQMDRIDSEPGHEAVSVKVSISKGARALYVRSSDDGSRVYFISTAVLAANKNENEEAAKTGVWNLYVYDTVTKKSEKTAFIAQAEPGGPAEPNIANGVVEVEAQVSGCPSAELGEAEEPGCEGGRFFVFTSTAKLTRDAAGGTRQVFEYDAKTGRLVRVSLGEGGYGNNGNGNALGASIAAPEFGATGAEAQAELFEDGTRAVSDDGSTVVFRSSGALSPRAVNDLHTQAGPLDVYEWHDGQVSLISTGHSPTSDEGPTIAPSGRDIFFTSTENILPQDSDGLMSLYDARIEGGFRAAPDPVGGCNGDACQGPPSVPNLLAAPASATFSGLGNPTPAVSTPAVKSKAKSKPKQCKKGYVKNKKKCVKRKKKAKKASHNGRAK
jgi:hypothetical protein